MRPSSEWTTSPLFLSTVALNMKGTADSSSKVVSSHIKHNNNFEILLNLCAEILILSLRPQMSALLSNESNLFADILNSIPEKSLNKVRPLIAKLSHQLNPLYRNFGKTVIRSIDLRLQKWIFYNSLSDKPDKEVYKWLAKNCDPFDSDEQIFFDIPTVMSSKSLEFFIIWLPILFDNL